MMAENIVITLDVKQYGRYRTKFPFNITRVFPQNPLHLGVFNLCCLQVPIVYTHVCKSHLVKLHMIKEHELIIQRAAYPAPDESFLTVAGLA
jgi:hypothetical protein